MSELTKEEREIENLVKQIKKALDIQRPNTQVDPPTPEEIQSKKELFKIILDKLNKADESKKSFLNNYSIRETGLGVKFINKRKKKKKNF